MVLQRWLGSRASLVRIAVAGVVVIALVAGLAAVASRGSGGTTLSGVIGYPLGYGSQFQIHNSSHNAAYSSFVRAPLHVWLSLVGAGQVHVYRWDGSYCFGTVKGHEYRHVTTAGTIENVLPTTPTAASVAFQVSWLPSGSTQLQNSPCWTVPLTRSTPTITTTVHDPLHVALTTVAAPKWVHPRVEVNGPGGPATGRVIVRYHPNSTCTTATDSSAIVTATLSAGVVDVTQLTIEARRIGTHSFSVVFSERNDPAYGEKIICKTFTVQ